MSTAIRSAVIELGIRQLQAKLVPPDVTAILEAQKSLESMGTAAEQSAAIATKEWGNFAITVREMQQELMRAGDTFDKVLADAVAWEETLPRIAASTDQAAEAGNRHAEALGSQLREIGHLGHNSLLAARGVLFLLGADKAHQEAMIEKLFLLQGAIDLTKGLGGAYRDLAKLMKDVTAAEIAMKLANPEYAAVSAAVIAIAAALASLYKMFTATGSAVEHLTEDYKYNADQSEKVVELWEMQAAAAHTSTERLAALRAASAELYTEQVNLAGLADEFASRGYYAQAAELQERALEMGKKSLQVEQEKAEARRYEIEQQDRLIDKQLESLRIEQEKDRLKLNRDAGIFGLGPEGRAKLGMVLQQSNNATDLTKVPEYQLQFLATVPDENLHALAQREQARRYQTDPLSIMVHAAPTDPDTARTTSIRGLDEQRRGNDQKLDQIKDDYDKLATTIVNALRGMQSKIEEFSNAARVKATGRTGIGR